MAAPTPGTKPTIPTGQFLLPDGFRSLIVFSQAPTIAIWPVTLKFGGYDGGAKINITTMYNLAWRTFRLRQLKEKEDTTGKFGFDPNIFGVGANYGLTGLINNDHGVVTEFWPDGGTLCYYGGLMKMSAPELKEGDFPQFDATIVCTNWDFSNNVESGPVWTPSAGTP